MAGRSGEDLGFGRGRALAVGCVLAFGAGAPARVDASPPTVSGSGGGASAPAAPGPSTPPSSPGGGSNPSQVPGAASGGYRYTGPPYWVTIGPDGRPLVIGPPVYVLSPAVVPVPVAVPSNPGVPLGGPMPHRPAAPAPAPAEPRRRANPGKGGQLVTIGDRLFRAGNWKRAGERYEQAARTDPDAAAPRVRLAQVALVRGQYADAAEFLREAVAAEPAWLARAPNIETIYGEPREFQRTVAKLESHLLLEPADRDAWLVLGAQLYLSSQTRRAADVFLRLTDRKPDPALAAFLDATGAGPRAGR